MPEFEVVHINRLEDLEKIKDLKPELYNLAVRSVKSYGIFQGSFGIGNTVYHINIRKFMRFNFNIEYEMYEKFSKKCDSLGKTKAEVARKLISKWLNGEVDIE